MVAQAIVAGKSDKDALLAAGYSERTAAKQTTRIVQRKDVQKRIAELQQQVQKKAGWDAAKVLERLGEVVDADISEIYDAKDNLLPLKKWPSYWRRLVTRIESENLNERSHDGKQKGKSKSWDVVGTLRKVHTMDRLKALELIGRHKAVDAFVSQAEGDKHLHIHLHEQINSRVALGRKRAAERNAGRSIH